MPQGHLGPLIFILTINDVEIIIKESDLAVYADDMKISRQIWSPDDYILLQADMDRIHLLMISEIFFRP